MYQIKLNGKSLKVTAAEHRALSTLSRSNWAAKKAAFVEGSSPRYQQSILPRDADRRQLLGIKEVWKDLAKSRREKQFFVDHPRCQTGLFGNPRRINAILNSIHKQSDEQSRLELEYTRSGQSAWLDELASKTSNSGNHV